MEQGEGGEGRDLEKDGCNYPNAGRKAINQRGRRQGIQTRLMNNERSPAVFRWLLPSPRSSRRGLSSQFRLTPTSLQVPVRAATPSSTFTPDLSVKPDGSFLRRQQVVPGKPQEVRGGFGKKTRDIRRTGGIDDFRFWSYFPTGPSARLYVQRSVWPLQIPLMDFWEFQFKKKKAPPPNKPACVKPLQRAGKRKYAADGRRRSPCCYRTKHL